MHFLWRISTFRSPGTACFVLSEVRLLKLGTSQDKACHTWQRKECFLTADCARTQPYPKRQSGKGFDTHRRNGLSFYTMHVINLWVSLHRRSWRLTLCMRSQRIYSKLWRISLGQLSTAIWLQFLRQEIPKILINKGRESAKCLALGICFSCSRSLNICSTLRSSTLRRTERVQQLFNDRGGKERLGIKDIILYFIGCGGQIFSCCKSVQIPSFP